jgi:hypothetical protein
VEKPGRYREQVVVGIGGGLLFEDSANQKSSRYRGRVVEKAVGIGGGPLRQAPKSLNNGRYRGRF